MLGLSSWKADSSPLDHQGNPQSHNSGMWESEVLSFSPPSSALLPPLLLYADSWG